MIESNILNGNLRQLAKQWKLGEIAYRFYYAPKGFIQICARKGVVNMAQDFWLRKQMEQAAYQLPTYQIPTYQIPTVAPASMEQPLDVYFLTGKYFWYQTCFCAYSLAQQSDRPIRPVIYDDGSLTKTYQDAIYRIFPRAKIILKPDIDINVDRYLPRSQFPYLRERRDNYPNIRKLTDIHLGSQGWRLVLDSDMLFFRPPFSAQLASVSPTALLHG